MNTMDGTSVKLEDLILPVSNSNGNLLPGNPGFYVKPDPDISDDGSGTQQPEYSTQTQLFLGYPNHDIGGPQLQDIKPKPNILKNSSTFQHPKVKEEEEKTKTKIVLGMDIISCIVCTADRFPNYSELKKHLKHVHSEMEFIKCGLCFRPYLKTNQSAMAELKAHYKESHGI